MKNMKALLALLLALVMVFAMAACGAKDEAKEPAEDPVESNKPAEDNKEPADTDAEKPEEFGSYEISYNCLGAGVWILDFGTAEVQYYADLMGFGFQAPSANFTADQMLKDCQNLLNAGVDGHLYFGCFGTLTPTISELFEEKETYFVMPDQLPTEESIDLLLANPYFAGAVGGDPYKAGYQMGQRAAADGYANALMIAGAIGDTVHDGRLNGFEAGFTDAGGKIVGVARCSSPAEATEKADDMLAAYGADADCVYGATTDFINGAFEAMNNYDMELMGYCSDIDNTAISLIKEGKLIGDGGMAVVSSLGAALLTNALDGKVIKDADGNAAIFTNLMPFIVDAENCDDYNANWFESHPLDMSDYEQLLYRYNPDVDYNTWLDFIDNYNFEYVMSK